MIEYKNLKLLMKIHEVGVKDLANLTGKTRQSITNYLSGNRIPTAEWLCLVAEHFNCSTDCILDRVDLILTEKPKAGGRNEG